jgi:hypothetical protein
MGLAGLDDDDVEAERQERQRPAVGKGAGRDHRPSRVSNVAALAVVDGFLGEAESPRAAEADLDDHEASGRGWAGVDCDEVELVAADADVPGEDGPALGFEAMRDERLRLVASKLSGSAGARRSSSRAIHAPIVAARGLSPIYGPLSRAHRA